MWYVLGFREDCTSVYVVVGSLVLYGVFEFLERWWGG
jgi:hypothetical protein